MKLLISNFTDDDTMFASNLHNKLLWRIPDQELRDLGWDTIRREDLDKLVDSDDLAETFQEIYGAIPKVIFFWFQSEYNVEYRRIVRKLRDININLYGYIDDLHLNNNKDRNSLIQTTLATDLNGLFSSYAYHYYYYHDHKHNVIWLPHCVPERFIVPFNEKPKDKILLTGVICPDTYPSRKKMHEIRTMYAIDYLVYPGYKKPKHDICGKKYVEHLNRYLACFTCSSTEKTPYIVAKFFEIPLSGSLLFADVTHIVPQMDELGFIDGENYISVTVENMEEKIKYILNPKNRKEIDRIRLNGQELVKNRHLSINRAQKIDEYAN